ncbi:MAG: hypothetical protein NZL87_07225, partial [Thermomicrobium sp.]|nr:hypothetical protein [Thermomicrobium sp.]
RAVIRCPRLLGWSSIGVTVATDGIAIGQWPVLLAVAAPLLGASIAWFLIRRHPVPSLSEDSDTEGCKS